MPDENREDELAKSIARSVAETDQCNGYIHNTLVKVPLDTLEGMLLDSLARDFRRFNPDFVAACIRLQVSNEVIRRLRGMQDGTIAPSEANRPPSEDAADGWDQTPPAS